MTTTNTADPAPIGLPLSPEAAPGSAFFTPAPASGLVAGGNGGGASFYLAPRYVFRAYPGGVAERLPFCDRCAAEQHIGDVDARGGEVIAVCAFTRDRNRFGEEDLSRVECESCPAQVAEELKVCEHCGEAYRVDDPECPLCAADGAADYMPLRINGEWSQ